MTKQYAQRDIESLDGYMTHVMAMTAEQLNSKSNIAAELAWRDMQIAELQQKLDAVAAEVNGIREQAEDVYAAGYRHGHLNTVDGCAYATPVEDEFYHNALQVMLEVETPATDTYLNSVRADAIESVVDALASSGALTVGDSIVEVVKLAESIRSGTHDTADEAG